jgi:Protein of unknown function (DUF4238)
MMPDPVPPRSTKEAQHYVPRFWLRRFAGDDGRLRALENGAFRPQVSLEEIMVGDWTYTVFDEWWRHSDRLEDALAKIETDAANLFDSLHASRELPTDDKWIALCAFLALTACRHPETMRRGYERGKEMAWAFAEAGMPTDRTSLLANIKARFGFALPPDIIDGFMKKGLAPLLSEAEEVEGLSPQGHRLPEQLSLSAFDLVTKAIVVQNLFLLDAPEGTNFILSDRPLPLRELARGFSVPLSRKLAFVAVPADGSGVILSRRPTSTKHAQLVNHAQAQRTRSIVIGPDRAVLEAAWAGRDRLRSVASPSESSET